MKSIKTPLLLIGGGLAAFYLFRNVSSFAKTYSARVGSVRFNNRLTSQSLFFKIFFDVNLILNNPSQFTGVVNGVKLNVLFNGRVIGTIEKNTAINIPRQSETAIPVNLGVSTLNIFPSVNAAIIALKGNKPINLTVAGTVLTNYGPIEVNNVSTVSF